MNNATLSRSLFSARTLHNGKSVVSNNKKLFIVLFVLHMTGLPLIMLASILQLASHDLPDPEIYMMIAMLTSAAAGLAGMACALMAMPYLFKKTSVDMRLSLPMTTGQRFFSDFFAGLFTYTIPFIVSQCVSLLLMLTGHIMFDGRAESEWISYSTSSEVLNYFSEMVPYVFKLILIYFVMMLMYYTMCVLVMTCCGSILENITYILLLNILIPATILSLTNAVCENVKGLSPEFFSEYYLPVSSPAGMLYYLISSLDSDDALLSMRRFLGLSLMVTLVFGAASYLIYRHRKAEDTGKPVVYDIFYFVMTSLSVAALCFFFLMIDEDFIIPMIIITAIFYFVMAVIRNRGFRKFGKYVIAYVITLAASCALFGITVVTGGFGAANRVPAPITVSKVYISYNGMYEPYQSGFSFLHDQSGATVLSERDDISLVTDIHRDAISEQDRSNELYLSKEINILYQTRTGGWIYREYFITDETFKKLSKLDTSKALREHRAQTAVRSIAEIKKEVYATRRASKKYYIGLYPVWIGFTNTYYGPDRYDKYSVNAYDLPSDFFDRLSDVYTSDIMDQDEENYLRPKGREGYIRLEYVDLYVNEDYTATMEYLKSVGFPELTDMESYDLSYVLADRNTEMISIPMYEAVTGKNTVTSTSDSSLTYRTKKSDELGFDHYSYSAPLIDDREGMLTILKNAKDHYYSDDVKYLIVHDGITLAVMPENNDIADVIFMRSYTQGLFNSFDDSLPNSRYNGNNLRLFLEIYGDLEKKYDGQQAYDVIESAADTIDTIYSDTAY